MWTNDATEVLNGEFFRNGLEMVNNIDRHFAVFYV